MFDTYDDVLSASKYLAQRETLPRIMWGRSMGCAPAMRAASEHGRSVAVILESAFLSPLMTVIPFHMPFETRFENIEEIRRLPQHIPILFIHGLEDDVVPFWHGKHLHALCESHTKRFLAVEGGTHNNLHSGSSRSIVEGEAMHFIDAAISAASSVVAPAPHVEEACSRGTTDGDEPDDSQHGNLKRE